MHHIHIHIHNYHAHHVHQHPRRHGGQHQDVAAPTSAAAAAHMGLLTRAATCACAIAITLLMVPIMQGCIPELELPECYEDHDCPSLDQVCDVSRRRCVPRGDAGDLDPDTGEEWPDWCNDGRGPEPEVCDDHDNNCDGTVDNVEGLGQECQTGLPSLCADGILQCDLDSGPEPVCVPLVQPGELTEVCDGQDNNCDGEVDNVEGLGDPCDTGLPAPCDEGLVTCEGATETKEPICWRVQRDYDVTDGQCRNSMVVSCEIPDPIPPNTVPIIRDEDLTYTEAEGWTEPAQCEVECATGFVYESDECINTKLVPCQEPTTLPEGTFAQVVNVTIHYQEVSPDVWAWSEPPVCDLLCEGGYVWENEVCINEKLVPCSTQGIPDNADSSVVNVLIHYIQVDGVWRWESPPTCDWECSTGFGRIADQCLNEQQVPCSINNLPLNSEPIPGEVTINYVLVAGAWQWQPPPQCDWHCQTGYDQINSQCVNELQATCSTDGLPEHSMPTMGQVTIYYTETEDGDWQWSSPSQCDWDCKMDYRRQDHECVLDIPIMDCNLRPPMLPVVAVNDVFHVQGQVQAPGTEMEGQKRNIIAKLCHTAPQLGEPTVDLEDPQSYIHCLDADYVFDSSNSDVYEAHLPIIDFGRYAYLFAFSGDDGNNWHYCDYEGIVGDHPRVDFGVLTTYHHVPNGNFDDWIGPSTPREWSADNLQFLQSHDSLSGNYSAELSSNGPNAFIITPNFEVLPNMTYRLSAWVKKHHMGEAAVGMRCTLFNSANQQIAILDQPTSSTPTWQQETMDIQTPQEARWIRIEFAILDLPDYHNQYLLDNVELIPIIHPR